jgi:magnesium transporter
MSGIDVRCYHDGQVSTVEDPTRISDGLDEGHLLWIDLVDPGHADFTLLVEELQLHPLALEDALKHGQRPKLEQYPSHSFLVAYAKELTEVDLFIGPSWVVSVRATGEDGQRCDIETIRTRFQRYPEKDQTVGMLVYVFLDDLVDGYFETAEDFEDCIEDFEEQILAEDGNESDVQAELLRLRRRLVELRRKVIPLREVIASLLHSPPTWVHDVDRLHLQDVYDHVIRVADQLDSQRELIGNAVEAHLAMVSNRVNRVMKTMTSWGALLLGSTLVAGIYGMNFEHMPELDWQLGYPFALGIMATMTVVGHKLFKRNEWL